MENLQKHSKAISDLERDIQDIKDLEMFSNWIEHALELTSSIWGKSSTQYINTKNIKMHYIVMPTSNHFNLNNALDDAYEIIEICEEGLK